MLTPLVWHSFNWGRIDTAVHVSFANPTTALLAGADMQQFSAQVRKVGAGNNPVVSLELYEGGGKRADVLSNQVVSSTSGAVVSGGWDIANLSNPAGTDVELRVWGQDQDGAQLEIGALAWAAATAPPIQAGFLDDSTLYGAELSQASTTTGVGVAFANPTRPLAVGSGLQTFRVQVRKIGAAVEHPTVSLELYEAGTLRATLLANQSVSSTTGTLIMVTWNASLLNNLSGADVQLRVIGNGVVDGLLEIGALRWTATLSDAALIICGFLDDSDLYGAAIRGPQINIAAAYTGDGAELYGTEVRGPLAKSSYLGALVATDIAPGYYAPTTVSADHVMFGATLTGGGIGAGHLGDGAQLYGATIYPDQVFGDPLLPSGIVSSVGYSGSYTLLTDDPQDALDATWIGVP